MKRFLTVLMLAAMVLSTGCGNKVEDAAKQAEQKVEQKVDEAKQDAAAKVDEAKQDAAAKVDEAKQDAANAVNDAAAKMNSMAESMTGRVITLGGVMPGVTFDEAKSMLGEPVSMPEDDVYIFDNGLLVEIDLPKNIVEEISITQVGVKSADGVEVGMPDYSLNEYCGAADAIEQEDNGEVEYKYFSGDKKSSVTYKTRNGMIYEISCSLND